MLLGYSGLSKLHLAIICEPPRTVGHLKPLSQIRLHLIACLRLFMRILKTSKRRSMTRQERRDCGILGILLFSTPHE